MTDKLSIRVEVPALELTSSGVLLGSSGRAGPDALDAVRERAAKPLGIPLGPDSVATLSFTSGSTGIPKGVRGRHFSLTHFFPWMKERFGLSDESRFTMLSGIAHDPIQRDIFTPLFLGASLYIPTAEDIGTPGRLAEWMADKAVTVTHLTPAMGQLLSAQATRLIPSLRNAFFVGDILTKRDCTRLQQLAQNCRIINMFGTTETQRAVSYFPIPPLSEDPTFLKTRKDIMPAGSGMINVQLLVVNRADKNQICAVGEVGEIYVRSGGLAEGYLQLPDATREKFVDNWFGAGVSREDSIAAGDAPWKTWWHGVRDRMYRTGDLGRYNPDGTVECTGRADDQIKIRGFRIELGEIDTHLSRHPAVRENVTLVRRDKYEEKVLVAYFVPLVGSKELEGLVSGDEDEDDEGGDEGAAKGGNKVSQSEVAKGLRRYRKLIKSIREYLKTKLPSYSVPSGASRLSSVVPERSETDLCPLTQSSSRSRACRSTPTARSTSPRSPSPTRSPPPPRSSRPARRRPRPAVPTLSSSRRPRRRSTTSGSSSSPRLLPRSRSTRASSTSAGTRSSRRASSLSCAARSPRARRSASSLTSRPSAPSQRSSTRSVTPTSASHRAARSPRQAERPPPLPITSTPTTPRPSPGRSARRTTSPPRRTSPRRSSSRARPVSSAPSSCATSSTASAAAARSPRSSATCAPGRPTRRLRACGRVERAAGRGTTSGSRRAGSRSSLVTSRATSSA